MMRPNNSFKTKPASRVGLIQRLDGIENASRIGNRGNQWLSWSQIAQDVAPVISPSM